MRYKVEMKGTTGNIIIVYVCACSDKDAVERAKHLMWNDETVLSIRNDRNEIIYRAGIE